MVEISLSNLFCDYMQDTDFEDSEEYKNAVDKIDAFVTKISLNQKLKSELEDLIGENQFKAQQQGFINGFKYAMALKKECGLL